MHGTRQAIRLLFLVAAVLLVPEASRAADDTWASPADGFFHIDGNWTDNSAPTAADTVEFDVAGTYQVWWDSITGNRTTQSMGLTEGDVTFRITDSPSSPYTWTITDGGSAGAAITGGTLTLGLAGYTGTLVLDIDGALKVDDDGTLDVRLGNEIHSHTTTVGSEGDGMLVIRSAGRIYPGRSYVGYSAGHTGTVKVTGAGSIWDTAHPSGHLYVGYHGEGTLTIEDGGSVSTWDGQIGDQTGSSGDVAVVGENSSWFNRQRLIVGGYGEGTLTVTDGGSVSCDGGLVASCGSSSGDVDITGEGSSWRINRDLWLGGDFVADGGDASLTLSAGGRVYVGGFDWRTVALDESDSAVVLSNAPGAWGELLLRNGATLNSDGYCYLGYNADETGTATVTGADTLLTNVFLSVGHHGEGTLTVTGGGRVPNVHGYVGYDGVSTGTVNVDGGTWTNSDDLSIGGSDIDPGGTGTVAVLPDALLEIGQVLRIWPDGTLTLAGGTVRFGAADPLDDQGGTINYTFGTVEFDADVTIPAGSHTVNAFFGPAPTLTPLQGLTVTGQATLMTPVTLDGGTLSVGSLVYPSFLTFNTGTFNLTGPAVTVVGSSGSTFGPSLSIGPGQVLGITDGTVGDGGTLRVQDGGQVNVGSLANGGRIVMDGVTSYLGGTALTNTGLLTGTGHVNAALQNEADGRVEVGSGQHLLFTAAGNTNAGTIQVIGGGAEFTQDLTNAASTGLIAARDATLCFGGGLVNDGSVAMTFGATDLFGDISNTASGLVVVSGGGNAAFYDDLVNDGEVRISAGSNAVFYGEVSGEGDFTGSGTVYLEGDLRPGHSPAEVDFGGDVVLGPQAALEIELAGTAPGTEHDVFDVGGSLTLGGLLNVLLLDGYSPVLGDKFDVLDWGTLAGEFDTVNLPDLAGGLTWDTSGLYDAGGISVTPEPATLALLAIGGFSLVACRRRKRSA